MPWRVPYYDIDVTAGVMESFSDAKEIPAYYMDMPQFSDCTAAFPVYGESMEPKFNGGEIVIVKEVTNPKTLLWGESYLIITNADSDNLRTIKCIFQSPYEDEIILRAINPKYEGDTRLDKSSIIKMYLIKGKIQRIHL